MREILFRGKRIDNGEWVEGFYCQRKEKIFGGVKTRHMILVPDADSYSGARWIDVDPTTVGQYTGVTDKNGKKIFEGDIVKYDFDLDDGFIDFTRGAFYLRGLNNEYLYQVGFLKPEFWSKYYTVVGNIHDNPERLNLEAKA